jgi:hypothetical protein
MKRFSITSDKIDGQLIFEYGDDRILKGFINEANLTEAQQTWLASSFPINANAFDSLVSKSIAKNSNFQVIEITQEIDFKTFYDEYAVKEGKQEAIKAWNKLPASEQLLAYVYIKTYRTKKAKQGTAMAYPATYLNQRFWNDNK